MVELGDDCVGNMETIEGLTRYVIVGLIPMLSCLKMRLVRNLHCTVPPFLGLLSKSIQVELELDCRLCVLSILIPIPPSWIWPTDLTRHYWQEMVLRLCCQCRQVYLHVANSLGIILI